ncbi:hypothetical protein C942_00944 [Photobacterium marinum]|uniref:Uncharacterized protein n=1 Tax=Photobacterium marinum TaxID=1056511 RepID=L8JEL4_9GAMM|nr:hypothetical protein [Photobacterium marinum]ELR65857.1 hypothetical protein C942_00944 [Photobacterium marinum]
MSLIEQAQMLFKHPLTIESLRQLDRLEKQARGEEADRIGELWEAVLADADEELLNQAREEGLL